MYILSAIFPKPNEPVEAAEPLINVGVPSEKESPLIGKPFCNTNPNEPVESAEPLKRVSVPAEPLKDDTPVNPLPSPVNVPLIVRLLVFQLIKLLASPILK